MSLLPDYESYVTLMPTTRAGKFLVVVMKYHVSDDEYIMGECSHPLDRGHAETLAARWAHQYHLEVRL